MSAKQVQRRRGNTSEHGTFVGAAGEITVDTDQNVLVVHDGITAGGHRVAKNDLSNITTMGRQSLLPAGIVNPFAGATAPAGWLVCNGAAVSRSTYSALFTAIGTAYGVGDGSTTFNLPDLRGEFLRGLDGGRGVDTGRTLGSAQTDQMRKHSHRFGVTGDAGSGGRNIIRESNITITGAASNGTARYVSDGNQNFSGVTGGTNQTTFMGNEVRPRNVAMNFIIKT